MSELRDRIAAAIKAADKRVAGFISYEERADAVIEALDLRIEDKYKTASGQKLLFGVSGFFEVEVDGD